MPVRRPSTQSASGDHGVEVRAGDRPEQQDQHRQAQERRGGVLEQLQADVAGREALSCDAGADDDGDEQGGADQLCGQPASHVQVSAVGGASAGHGRASVASTHQELGCDGAGQVMAGSVTCSSARRVDDASFDLVADRSHGGDVEAGGVLEDPFLVPLAGEDRAGVAAAHGDDRRRRRGRPRRSRAWGTRRRCRCRARPSRRWRRG